VGSTVARHGGRSSLDALTGCDGELALRLRFRLGAADSGVEIGSRIDVLVRRDEWIAARGRRWLGLDAHLAPELEERDDARVALRRSQRDALAEDVVDDDFLLPA
jgi:hypothetical protein